MINNTYTQIEVRGIIFQLYTYNRSLELCARMNYETENLDFIDSLSPGSVMYDLGACEGRFTIYALKRGLKVYSFEPDKNNFNILNENLKINKEKKKRMQYCKSVSRGLAGIRRLCLTMSKEKI
jgi:predicted RNA methylase